MNILAILPGVFGMFDSAPIRGHSLTGVTQDQVLNRERDEICDQSCLFAFLRGSVGCLTVTILESSRDIEISGYWLVLQC